MKFWNAVLRVFDMSLGQMLWSRRTVFMALATGAPVRHRRALARHFRNGAVVVQDQRRAGARPRDFRRHDLAVVSALHRPCARRVLRHVPHIRRSRRSHHHVSVHPARSKGRRHHRQIPGVRRVHRARGPAVGHRGLSAHHAGVWGQYRRHVPAIAHRPRAAGAGARRIRRRVRADRGAGPAAPGGRTAADLRMGAGRAAGARLSPPLDGRALSAGARAALDAPGRHRGCHPIAACRASHTRVEPCVAGPDRVRCALAGRPDGRAKEYVLDQ